MASESASREASTKAAGDGCVVSVWAENSGEQDQHDEPLLGRLVRHVLGWPYKTHSLLQDERRLL